MDDRPYFYRLRGRTLGPVGLRQIRQLAQRAQIGRTTDVSRDGTQWAKAADFPEIFDPSIGFEPPQAAPGGAMGEPVVSSDIGGFGGGAIAPTVAGPRWYYTVGGSQQGPVDEATLRQLVASGNVPSNEHAIPEGGTQWMPIGGLPQFASVGVGFGGQGPIINVNTTPGGTGSRRPEPQSTNGLAIAGFVLALISVFLACLCGLFSVPVSGLALIFSAVGMAGKNASQKGLAIAGLIISLVAIVLGIVNAMIGIAMLAGSGF